MQATRNDWHFHIRQQLAAKELPLTDEQLVLRYRQTGDRECFSQLVYRYERELYTYLRRYLGDAELAEDAFQATFTQVHLKCHQFQADRKFRPWLYTIATNQAIDARRRTRRHRMASLDQAADNQPEGVGSLAGVLASTGDDPAVGAEQTERQRIVRRALEELPEAMSSVVHLVYFQGLKYREAAEVLAMPVGTVKSRMHVAMARLTEILKTSHVE
jgi:RNA polymerase sigma-70 factor (ECF subfamily)